MGWFRHGSYVVQVWFIFKTSQCVVYGKLVQIWFSCLQWRGYVVIVQFCYIVDAVMCGMIWVSFGSALMQLVVGIAGLEVAHSWFSWLCVCPELLYLSIGSIVVQL